jgi:hypothetical protein
VVFTAVSGVDNERKVVVRGPNGCREHQHWQQYNHQPFTHISSIGFAKIAKFRRKR